MLMFSKSFQDSESRQPNRSEIAYQKIASIYKNLLPVCVEQNRLYEPTWRNCGVKGFSVLAQVLLPLVSLGTITESLLIDFRTRVDLQ